MKRINFAQLHVDNVRAQIVLNGIPIEHITVFDKELPAVIIMSTSHGKIYLNNQRGYEPGEFEQAILHEIGHRAVPAINPKFEGDLERYLNFSSYINNIQQALMYNPSCLYEDIGESLAEVFANYVFPKFVQVSYEGWQAIKKSDRESYTKYEPYGFFVEEYRMRHWDGLKKLIESLPNKDESGEEFMRHLLKGQSL